MVKKRKKRFTIVTYCEKYLFLRIDQNMDESATPLKELPRKKVTVTSIKKLKF